MWLMKWQIWSLAVSITLHRSHCIYDFVVGKFPGLISKSAGEKSPLEKSDCFILWSDCFIFSEQWFREQCFGGLKFKTPGKFSSVLWEVWDMKSKWTMSRTSPELLLQMWVQGAVASRSSTPVVVATKVGVVVFVVGILMLFSEAIICMCLYSAYKSIFEAVPGICRSHSFSLVDHSIKCSDSHRLYPGSVSPQLGVNPGLLMLLLPDVIVTWLLRLARNCIQYYWYYCKY